MLVKFFATYRDITKCSSCQLAAPRDIAALLAGFSARFPQFSDKLLSPDGLELGAEAVVLVNGRHITHLQGLATPLTEEDIVAIFPLVAGG